jgi:hypothetical protein
MKKTRKLLIRPSLRGLVLALAVFALSSQVVRANPYASMVTNINYAARTMQFWLNEGGGTVTVAFNNSTTAPAPLDGSTAVASGAYTFTVPATATSYTITCYKVGAGQPALIQTSPGFTPRGVDVNKNVNSPNFGRVYVSISGSPINILHPDMTLDHTAGAGSSLGGTCNWYGGGFSPYRLFVAADDYLMVGDASFTTGTTGSFQNDGVWRIDPNVTAAQLFLGPRGGANGIAGIGAGPIHSSIQSRPVVLGNPSLGGPVTLVTVDGDYTWTHGYNSLLVYTNITLATLPWENVPDIQGPAVGLNIAGLSLGGNEYPGLQFFGNYIYAGTYRENYAYASVQIYTNDFGNGNTFAQVWNSISSIGGTFAAPGPDLFCVTNFSANTGNHGTVDVAVSPDGKYCVAQAINNWFVIAYLTNGIPDSSRVFYSTPTSFTGNGRGIAFDAAGNIYSSSSGIGNVQEWSLGITATSITAGDTNTSTSFSFSNPATQVSVVASPNFASQGGVNGAAGTPTKGVFTITRSGNTASTLPVTFTIGGTATAGVYTVQSPFTVPTSATVATTNTVLMAAGQASTNIIITPTTANVPRLQTTVTLNLLSGAAYSPTLPFSDTVYMQNTSSNELFVTARAATMYKAFSNDFASILFTRLGDTNVSYTIPANAFSYVGSAFSGIDFTPLAAVTFNKGDLTQTATISPLSNGVPPADTLNPTYAGNKSVIVTVAGGASYGVSAAANSTTLTLLDNANPPSTVVLADPLTDSADAANWNITFGNGNSTVDQGDYDVEFGYDLTSANPSGNNGTLGIGLPPSGATTALRITCNKSAGYGAMYGGGVNVYYTNQLFTGNYAVRFNMNVVGGDNSYSVEGVMFGINHNGIETNWWLGNGGLAANTGPWASDGNWYWIQTPPGGYGGFGFSEFQEYTGASALPNTGWQQLATASGGTYQNAFKGVLFSGLGNISGGTPANNSPVSASPKDTTWSDVEIRQTNGVITLSIDHTPIFTNSSPLFTSGYLMLGYDCPIQGTYQQYIGTADAAAYFANLQVVSLDTPPHITSITTNGASNVVILFNGPNSDDTTASFVLQSAGVVVLPPGSPYADVNPPATFTQLGSGVFQVTYPQNGSMRYYRIRRL